MTIQCQCEHCGVSLKVKDKLAGTEGKCPKCSKKIHIPDASSDASEDVILGDDPESAKSTAVKKSAEEAEEDAIFGDDFFKLQEAPPRPRYVAPVITDDDDEDEEPAPKKRKKSKAANSEARSDPDSNAASIASSLLSKTGKRNRPDDFKDPAEEEDPGYDYSEINYLLLNRVLPGAGAAIVLFSFFYWLFAGMMGGGVELPELAELTGRVTNNGDGVAAQLVFLPKTGSSSGGGSSGSSSMAIAAPDGSYEAFYKDDIPGLVLGPHEVRINAGTLRVTREINVEAGSQELNFELTE